MKISSNVIQVETQKTLFEKERDELFDECYILRNQVEELINENKFKSKSKKFEYNMLYF